MCPQFPVLFPVGKSVCRKKPFSLLLWHVLTPLSSGFHEIITKIHTETERPFSKAVHSRQLRANCRKCRKKGNRFVENVAFKRENSVRCDKNYGKSDSVLQKPAVHAIIKLYRQMKGGIPCVLVVCMTRQGRFLISAEAAKLLLTADDVLLRCRINMVSQGELHFVRLCPK